MPRSARQNNINDSKIYHLILKGVNSQEIFFEDSDRLKLLDLLKQTKEMYPYDIYAYVLMDNHIHLIVFDEQDNLSQIMHKICTIYAIYFNKKYERTGHLFQDRFKSKCVNTEIYLLNLQRYIHKNPQKDGICKMENYRWSSYKEYIGIARIVNTKFILDIFSEDRKKAVERFINYNKMDDNEYEIKEFTTKNVLTDEQAINEIKKKLQIENVMSILNLNINMRDEKIREIANMNIISKKQIARILGISKRTIQRAVTGK